MSARRRDLVLIDYRDALAPHFNSINRAWVEEMFVVEPHDDAVLSNPRHHIIDPGGAILFVALPDGDILGAGALMPSGRDEHGRVHLELTKMGVSAAARGSGAGGFLLDGLIARAKAMMPASLYLLTSWKCEAAIHLYERAGFVHDPEVMARHGGTYQRASVSMTYPLTP